MYKMIMALLALQFSAMATTIDNGDGEYKVFNDYAPEAKVLAQDVVANYLSVAVQKVYFPKGCQYEKLQQAFELMEKVVNSEAFKEKVIGYIARYSGQREYTSNNGLSNEEVYMRLMEGTEIMMQDTPGTIDLYVTKYNRWWSKVIAWTNPKGGDKYIHVNWRFYKRFGVAEMVSNLVHEWIHLMGFYHSSAADSDSVPYAVGRIAGEVASSMLGEDSTKLNFDLISHNF